MASQKQAIRTIAGTLDYMSPADKVAESVARSLENFRVDQVNQLRSRRGATLAVSMGSGKFHTIKLNPNGDTVFGVGSGMFVGAGTPVVNHAKGSPDGQHMGVATYLGSTYVMNRGTQVRLDGADAWPWTPDPPTTQPLATAITPSANILNNLDGSAGTDSITTMVTGSDPVPCMTDDAPVEDPTNGAVAAIDNGNFQSAPASLSVIVNQGCTIVLDAGEAGNTTTAGAAGDADQFSLWVYCTDPTQVRSLTITLENPALDGATQGKTVTVSLLPGTAWDPAKILNQTPNTWTQVFIRRTLNVDALQAVITAAPDQTTIADLTGQLTQFLQNPAFLVIAQQNPQILGINNTPIIAANAPDFDWTQVSDVQISVVTTGAVQLNFNQFQVSDTLNAAAALSGSGQYFISLIDEAGHDSLPTPASDPITVTNQGIQLTNLAIGALTNIVARNVWRIGFGSSDALLVGQVLDNSNTGPWIDPTTTNDAEASAVYMPIDRVPPPKASGLIGPFFGKLVAFSTEAHPSRYYWTPAGIPWAFPGGDDAPEGNWEDAGGDDDTLIAATNHKTALVFYKNRSIWRLPGDPAKTDPIQTNANIGIVGPKAVCAAGDLDYFVSAEGVYAFNLDAETKISSAIDGIFKGDYVQLDATTRIPPIDPGSLAEIAIEISNERLRVAYPELGSSQNDTVLIYNTTTGAWMVERYAGLSIGSMAYWGTGLPMTAGMNGGGWYSLEDGKTDGGAPIALRWQTGAFDQGLPDFYKWYSDIEIEAWAPNGGSVNLTVEAIFNSGKTVVTCGTATVTNPTKQTFTFKLSENPAFPVPAGGSDYGWRDLNCAIRITGNATGEIIIGAAYLHFYPEERVARTFDSGSTDFQIPEKVKQVDYLEFYLTGTGQALQRTLASDLPGRLLSIRDQANMQAPSGRGDVRFRLASIVEGRNFRLTVNDSPSGQTFQVHKARARMRPVGEYIDGSNGEYFESAEFSVSPGRVGELKDFLLDYDVSGPGGQLVLYSDLPGSVLSVRRTLPIPAQGSRAPYVFPFEDESDQANDFLPVGQLFKVRLYPPAGGILRLHGRAQFRGRLIGTYFNGANGEIFQTQPIELMGGHGLARELLATVEAAGPMNLSISTEIPGNNLPAFPPLNVTLAPAATSAGRVPIRCRFPGNTKGILWRFTLSGPYICRLFELKIWGRRLMPNPTGWDWIQVPVDGTSNEWANIAMPCGQTPAEFIWIDVPVDPIG